MSTISSYTSDGAVKQYDITFAYADADTVKVRVNGTDVPFTFVSASRVDVTTQPATGALVEVYRKTPVTSPVVDFSDGSSVIADDLDAAVGQARSRTEELDSEVEALRARTEAGLTGTELTARLDLFTATLRGATPASGGGTDNFLRADGAWVPPPGGGGGGGSVTSVGLALPSIFNITVSPVTTSGTLTATLASQAANLILASPNGSAGAPSFRSLVTADIQSALPFTSTAEIRAGTSATKAVNPQSLAAAQAFITLTDAATTNWDFSAGFNAKWTLGGNRTLSVSNPQEGFTYTVLIYQDGTGSRTVTWPASFNWGVAGAPTLTTTASKHDVITLLCTDATTPKFDAFLNAKGF